MHREILSIILTAHNCEAYLDKTLATLLSSLSGLNEGYEIILISDASVDRTSEILQQFVQCHPRRTRLFLVNFRNIGKVRNFGVQQCSGDYVTMLDGDDQLLASALCDIVHFLADSQPELLLTKLNEEHDDNDSDIVWTGLKPQPLSQTKAIKKFLIHKDIQAHFIGQFVKRKLLLTNPFPPFCCYEDSYLFPTILRNCQHIVFSRSSPYLYFKHKNSLSSKINRKKVKLIVVVTEEMERVFGYKYVNLISCHWINIFQRYDQIMNNTPDRYKVIKRIKKINSIFFY